MDHLIPAVFDSGVFRPLEPVELAEGTQVQVQVPESETVPTQPYSAEPIEPQDEWEQQVVSVAKDCGTSLPDLAVSSEGLYE